MVGAAEAVQTSTSGNYGNVLTEKIIKDMPIVGSRGRNPLNLVLLQPGTFDGSNTGGGYHVHGARDRAWNFTLDGIDNNDPSAGGSNFSPTRTNPDALSELRVVTSNPTADIGRNSGATVLLVSNSGTNEFHGNGFWFYRTPRLNANEWASNFNRLGKRSSYRTSMEAASAARSGATRLSSSSTFSGSRFRKAGRPIAWCTQQTPGGDYSGTWLEAGTVLLGRQELRSMHPGT